MISTDSINAKLFSKMVIYYEIYRYSRSNSYENLR